MDISYIINQLGEERENYYNAVSPPIIQTSNFAFKDVEAMRFAMSHEREISCYTRGKNPTVEILRQKIAALEGSEDALIVSSGVSSISLAVLANVKQGDHIVCVKNPYSWTDKLLNTFLKRFGVSVSMIDGTKSENFVKSLSKNTTLFFMETPNSLLFNLQDIESVCKIAKERNIITVCDNSYSTFLNQQPISLGCDIVVYSSTKYINGHSDVVSGMLCSSKKMIDKIFANEFMTLGTIISPNDAWLILRGLRTLPLRLEKIISTTKKVIEFLKTQEKIEYIIYPYDENFAQYELARKQMKNGSGLFTIKLKVSSIKQAETFANSLKRFLIAVSWGGHESLILPTCGFTSDSTPFEYVRFSIGLEEPEVLIEDLKQALSKI